MNNNKSKKISLFKDLILMKMLEVSVCKDKSDLSFKLKISVIFNVSDCLLKLTNNRCHIKSEYNCVEIDIFRFSNNKSDLKIIRSKEKCRYIRNGIFIEISSLN